MTREAWLAFWLVYLCVAVRVVWGWWRIRFMSPIELLNAELARLRRQRRR